MAWELNRTLDLDLKRIEDLALLPGRILKQDADQSGFPRYKVLIEMDKASFYLISNRDRGSILLKKHRLADYVLLIIGSWYADKFPQLLDSIKLIPEVQTTFPIEPKNIASRLNYFLHESDSKPDKDYSDRWSGH